MQQTQKYNHIAILIDRSGSTQSIAPEIRKQFNVQAEMINRRAKESGQQTHLSLYTFSTVVDHPLLFEVPLGLVSLNPIEASAYKVDGMTALFDCVGRAVEDLSQFHRTTTGDHSFLVIVLTDGQENASKRYPLSLARQEVLRPGLGHPIGQDVFNISYLMKEKIATDVWTFAFLVPRGDKQALVNMGIPEGNVQAWDQTIKGVEEASRVTTQGLDAYFTARASGQRSVKSFFTDLSKVSKSDIQRSLVAVTGSFDKRVVEKEIAIQPFCEYKFGGYVKGNAYYELTKKEEIQDYKKVLVEDRTTGDIYGGPEARTLLGFPSGGTIKVDPGNHGNYRVYVQSTSVNRKLVRGTSVLYFKGGAAGGLV